ncbi:hypothetical protein ACRASX_07475 [Flavobacterium sp. TMP13]|uniref:hypothetical protein n=1 Tax=Flavobacterium sp. TMP13 TaxID=3425950 RepID=UPI003D771D44
MNDKGIYIVIVLYKTKLEESKTIISLQECLVGNISILVFDNSPKSQYESNNFVFNKFNILYHHDSTNPGLSGAYNYALFLAKNTKSRWLMLLDQDTIITKDYINEIENLNFNEISNRVVAIIPTVVSLSHNKIIAPVKVLIGGIFRPVTLSSGEVKDKISGINSGTLLRTSYLDSIGGFSKNYTLDMLDHWYFRKIFKDKKSIYLLRSNILQNLSIDSGFEENVSFNRYKQMLKAEKLFVQEDGLLSRFVYKARLIFRLLKQITYRNKDYFKLTLKHVFITQ